MPQRDSDTFTYGDGNLVTVSSNKWTALSGFTDLVVVTNEVTGTAGVDHVDVITTWAGSLGDQYAEITYGDASSLSAHWSGVTVHSDGVSTCYLLQVTPDPSTSPWVIYKVTSGPTFSQLTNGSLGAIVSGDVIRLTWQAGTLSGQLNGAAPFFTHENSDILSGKPGLWVFGDTTSVTAWAAGDFAASETDLNVNLQEPVIGGGSF